MSEPASSLSSDVNIRLPVLQFLDNCWAEYSDVVDGEVANYIPELSAADPDNFGIAISTVDGFVHAVGDADIEFTIQSVSKAFVLALALDLFGYEEVAKTIGVEPSGEAFNSVRLSPSNKPFNPMVNAGAIACTGLIYSAHMSEAFDLINDKLNQFAGRSLATNEKVYESERRTGDRNRAIAWLLRNYGKLHENVDESVDTYFRQCAILVTARDISIMGATLANNGKNPITGETVVSEETCARVLSVMASCGMYDYSGEWVYRVGIPAKSGVGGGIVAALPAQMGLGVFSPPLDALGNSVRGLKVCESISSHFELHVLKSQSDVESNIAADLYLKNVGSSRDRRFEDRTILEEHGHEVRVIELAGALNFLAADYFSRRVDDNRSTIVIIDFAKVAEITIAAQKIIATAIAGLQTSDSRVVFSNLSPEFSRKMIEAIPSGDGRDSQFRVFPTLNDAIIWAEDQIIFLYGGFSDIGKDVELAEQALLKGFTDHQLQAVREHGQLCEFSVRDKIIEAGEVSDSMYFLLSGSVSVKLANGTTVATLDSGTCFGEFALVSPDEPRSADVYADTRVRCLRLSVADIRKLTLSGHDLAESLLKNLATLLVDRLRGANARLQARS